MGKITGLKAMQNAVENSNSSGSDVKWVKLADGARANIRFLQELDADSPSYDPDKGLGFIAVEHKNPKNFFKKILCSIEDQSRCFGCEQHKKDFKAKWGGQKRLYINVLFDNGKDAPEVQILSQGTGPKSITPTLVEYAGEMGSITNLVWGLRRSGMEKETSYTVIPKKIDEKPFDTSGLVLFDLEEVAVRDLPYEEQEAFLLGDGYDAPAEDANEQSETGPNLGW
jgi:hypothetical protein